MKRMIVLTCLALSGIVAYSAAAETNPVVLDAKHAGWLSKSFAVEPNGRYRLRMRAKVEGPMTVEGNPEFREAFHDVSNPARGGMLPGWDKIFSGPKVPRGDLGIYFPYWYAFVSIRDREYVDEFYVPAGCDTLKVRYGLGRATRVEASEPVLEKVTADTVNINPRFACDEFCHAGYSMAGFGSAVRMIPKPEGGGCFLRIPTWVNPESVPVKPGVRYRVRFVLRPDTFSGANNSVSFSDADKKAIPHSGGRVLVKKALKHGEETFLAPPGAVRMGMLIGAADYESIEVTEVK